MNGLRQLPAPAWVLLIGSFLLGVGYFMVIPLLTVHMTQTLNLSLASTGIIVGVITLVQKGFSVVGGFLADIIDRRKIFLIGLLLRTVGFVGYAVATNFTGLLVAAVVASLGGALATPLIPAALSTFSNDSNRHVVFAARQVAANVAAALGPMVGALLLFFGPLTAFWGSAVIHAIVVVFAWLMLPNLGQPAGSQPTLAGILRTLRGDQRFLAFCTVIIGFWFIHTQLLVAFPLRAIAILNTGSEQQQASLVSLLFLINGISVIILQVVATPLIARLRPIMAFQAGVLLCAIGLLLAGVLDGQVGLFTAIIVFSAGEVLALPGLDLMISGMAPEAIVSVYFGISSLAWAIGGSVGSVAGGQLLESVGTDTLLPWLVFLGVGVLVVLALVAPQFRLQRTPEPAR